MLKETLKSIVLSQQEWITPEKREIIREQIGQFELLPPFVYILTGVRRSGKSTLLKQIMQQHGTKNYFNFEDTRATGFEVGDFLVLEELFSELFGNNALLFFDEIQNVPDWERYVRDACDRRKTVVITGSNASLLSRELGTKLTGRHIDYEVYPFSYREFLNFTGGESNPATFSTFLDHGGFPGYLLMGRDEVLSMLVSDILIRDIFTRYNLRNQEIYRRIVQYLLSNTSKEVSFNNLKNVFEVGSANSVMEFMSFLTDVYLLFLVPRYDTSLKVQVRNPRKVYAIDQGLVNFYSVSGSPDKDRLLENAVFLHLKRKSNEIWYFKGKRECDFIVRDLKNRYTIIQVCWQVGLQNETREMEGLLEAMDKLNAKEGYIITFDQEDQKKIQNKTIHLIPGWKWMTEA